MSDLLPDGYGREWLNQASRLTALRDGLNFAPRTILDIGCHHGHWSSLVHHVYPSVDILMIDGEPECTEHLAKKPFPFVIALLDSTAHEVDYHRCTSGCTEGNGLYRENGVAPFETVKRMTQTLDSIVGDRTFEFVKLDCQGGELRVLAGGWETMKRAHFVQLETQVQAYNEAAPMLPEVIDQMRLYGFRVFDLTDLHYNSRRMLLQVDVLFARADSPVFTLRPLS